MITEIRTQCVSITKNFSHNVPIVTMQSLCFPVQCSIYKKVLAIIYIAGKPVFR